MRTGLHIGRWVIVFMCIGAVARAGSNPAKELPDLGALSKLVGTWEADVDMDHDGTNEMLVITYHLTSVGSALVETMSPGSPHEMVTVYTRDGDDLILTHFCMIGNQPHMRAKYPADGKHLAFEFEGATGMASLNDAHMHSLTLDIQDDDTLQQTWSYFENGTRSSEEVFKLQRKK